MNLLSAQKSPSSVVECEIVEIVLSRLGSSEMVVVAVQEVFRQIRGCRIYMALRFVSNANIRRIYAAYFFVARKLIECSLYHKIVATN